MMLGPFDYALWLIGFLLEIFVVVCALYKRDFVRYFPLIFYMMCEALVTLGQFYCVHTAGFNSLSYVYYYYYTDSLLTILMFWVVIKFYHEVFDEMQVGRYIRGSAILILALTAIFSFAVVHQNQNHLTSRFVVELGQNLYFVGVVLTYVLWGAIMKLRETRTRLIQLVLALGVYFSATAGTYALRNLFPQIELPLLKSIFPIVGLWLPLAWAYTFMKVPENARLLTAELAVRTR
ncbi:MAG: hypothetical protein WAJ92_15785 [Candidatus Acidiferrales bacterium]